MDRKAVQRAGALAQTDAVSKCSARYLYQTSLVGISIVGRAVGCQCHVYCARDAGSKEQGEVALNVAERLGLRDQVRLLSALAPCSPNPVSSSFLQQELRQASTWEGRVIFQRVSFRS